MSDAHTDADGKSTRSVTKNGRGVLIYRQWKNKGGTRIFSPDWTRRIVHAGRQYFFNLGPNLREAAKYADQIDAFLGVPGHTMAMALERFAPEKRDRPQHSETNLGDVADAFRKARPALDISEKTAEGYLDRLFWIVRYVRAYRDGKKVVRMSGQWAADLSSERAIPVSFLTREVGSDFKAAVVLEAAGDSALEQVKKRSANSTLRNAKAVFSEAAREHLAGLDLPPTLDGFLATKPFRKVAKRYHFPPVDVVRRIFADAPLLKAGDKNAYVAFLLALWAGLRKGEIAAARRWWMLDAAGSKLRHRIIVQAEGDFLPKGRQTGYTEICDWAKREIMDSCRSITYLIEGNETERNDAVFRRLATWLQARGLSGSDRIHPVHELRKMFGSWAASRFDLFTAKTWCRHSSIRVTEDYYADLVVQDEVLNLWDPARELAAAKSGTIRSVRV